MNSILRMRQFNELAFFILIQFEGAGCALRCFFRLIYDRFQENLVLIRGNGGEPRIIFRPLKICADVKHGGADETCGVQKERNKHPAQSAVAVQKRVQIFQFGMKNPRWNSRAALSSWAPSDIIHLPRCARARRPAAPGAPP